MPSTSCASHLDCTYTACYCEENVYLLLKQLQQDRLEQDHQLFAVFISNDEETVPFWYQRSSQHSHGVVVWDYHVVALKVTAAGGGALIWDLDLQHPALPFPCTLEQYAQHALQWQTVQLPTQFQRMVRLVPAEAFLQHFASDRSHMRQPDGTWCAKPPEYPCIQPAQGDVMNLQRYRDMSNDMLQVARCPGGDAVDTCRHAGARTNLGPGEAEMRGHVNSMAALCSGSRTAECQDDTEAVLRAAPAHSTVAEEAAEASSSPAEALSHQPKLARGTAAADVQLEGNFHGAEELGCHVCWQQVVQAAALCDYGVVLHEDALLHCCLSQRVRAAGG